MAARSAPGSASPARWPASRCATPSWAWARWAASALGYASDIELLFVYSDSGSTAGPELIDNSEFFDRLVREVLRLVHAKREGIFHIDLRLRPLRRRRAPGVQPGELLHVLRARGARRTPTSGSPWCACGPSAGTGASGARWSGCATRWSTPRRASTWRSCARCARGRSRRRPGRGRLNAKFSPGALVDLEYAVQILQVMHGAAEKRLRTPRIHEALEALASIGVLEQSEAAELVRAYHFFRHLINGLRMLRGSAQDLFLPGLDSDEYLHLARRMGYAAGARDHPRAEAAPRFRDAHRGRARLRGAALRPGQPLRRRPW